MCWLMAPASGLDYSACSYVREPPNIIASSITAADLAYECQQTCLLGKSACVMDDGKLRLDDRTHI